MPPMAKKPTLLSVAAVFLLLAAGCSLLALKAPKGLNDRQARGWMIYTRRCAACHQVKGKGGRSASELTHIASYRDERWLRQWLHNPKSIAPRVKMPPPNLSESQIDDLVSYLLTLK